MKMRAPILAFLVAVCVAATACEKLPSSEGAGGGGQVDASKLADTIPLEYGNLIAATTNTYDPRWVTLWFEKPDKSIMLVGVLQSNGRVWTQPRVIGRK
jgi:hypothetical protein